jgi:ABC-type multidrug transport system fused ATPase/permease subunit
MGLRSRFFHAVLQQEVGFFESETSTGNLTQILNADVEAVQLAVGSKASILLQNAAQMLGGIIVAFIFSWKLTLVLLAISPLIAVAAVIQAKLMAKAAVKNSIAFQNANSLALEVIGGFRIVASFVWEDHAEALFLHYLNSSKKDRIKALQLASIGSGFSLFCIFAVYALGFWYGAQLVADTPANGGILLGDMLIVFFSVVLTAAAFGQVMNVFPELAKGRVALYNLMKVIDRTSEIDLNAETGISNVKLRGEVEFENVSFAFPSRPDQAVLKNLSLHIAPGAVVGVVGSSGAGKSTLVSLLERFYDAAQGEIRIDGEPIKNYSLKWLRENIGLVSQEPKLFDQSIFENIRLGKPTASLEEVMAAARAANAHNFITGLGDGYETRVGEGGCQLSGGQKQRIAIARAVLKNPQVILLDEATSALDNESEAVVQEALDRLMQGRTTIVVAHRLSTIKNSHVIIVMQEGQIFETGTHRELLQLNGLYYSLVVRQMNESELRDLEKNLKKSQYIDL